MLVIDTHAHLFSPDEEKYPPRENPARPPAGKGTIEHLRREMKANGVGGACAVQVSGFYRFDNRFICDSAKAHPSWIAGICTLDPNDPHSPGLLRQFAREYGVRGMRSVPARGGQLDHPGVRALWKVALDHGIVINLLSGHEPADQVDASCATSPTYPWRSTMLCACKRTALSSRRFKRWPSSRSTRTVTSRCRSSPTDPKDAPTVILATAFTRW